MRHFYFSDYFFLIFLKLSYDEVCLHADFVYMLALVLNGQVIYLQCVLLYINIHTILLLHLSGVATKRLINYIVQTDKICTLYFILESMNVATKLYIYTRLLEKKYRLNIIMIDIQLLSFLKVNLAIVRR